MTKRKQGKEPPLLVYQNGVAYRLRARAEEAGHVPDGVALDVAQSLVPVFLWRSVPVLVRHSTKINLVEQFTLEAALQLGTITAEELTALTALPEKSVRPLLTRLLTTEALTSVGPWEYAPTSAAEDILAAEAVVVEEASTQDFAYFPMTDELVTLIDAIGPWRSYLFNEKMNHSMTRTIPEEIAAATRSAVLNRHLSARSAYGCPPEVVEAIEAEEEEPLGNDCPVFLARPAACHHALAEGEPHHVDLTLHSRRQDKWSVQAHISGIDRLVAAWKGLALVARQAEVTSLLWTAIAGPASKVTEDTIARLALRPSEERLTPRYVLELPEEAARDLQRASRHLTDVVALRFEDEETALKIQVRFRPTDRAAARLFAIDQAAVMLGTDQSTELDKAISEASEEYNLDPWAAPEPEEVLDRTWQLKYYQAIYALRESDDFGYE